VNDFTVESRYIVENAKPEADGMVRTVLFRGFLLCISNALANVNAAVYELCGGVVQNGPFAGMRISDEIVWPDGNLSNKCLGSYEFELHPAVKKAIERKPDTVINAGCAEGYYAVGLGKQLPYSHVYAMDMEEKCLEECAKNAQSNGIINLVLMHGKVGAQDLIQGKGHKLFVIDIEGYELAVLDPMHCPDLLHSDIIVECHDFFYVGENEAHTSIISDLLEQRFSPTHDVERIEPQVPHVKNFPILRGLPLGASLLAITEKRPLPTAWLACWAKERGIQSG